MPIEVLEAAVLWQRGRLPTNAWIETKGMLTKQPSSSRWIALLVETLEMASDARQRLSREGISETRSLTNTTRLGHRDNSLKHLVDASSFCAILLTVFQSSP